MFRKTAITVALIVSLTAIGATGRAWAAAGCIDLNKASAAALTELDGIGTKKAQRTVAARKVRRFSSLLDWSKRVYGVGKKTVASNAARICRLGR